MVKRKKLPKEKKSKKPRKPFDIKNKRKWLISQLRRISLKWPPIYEKVNSQKITYYITSTKGKQLKRVKWYCELCNAELKSKEIKRDHVEPIVDSLGFQDIETFIDKLLCDSSNIQVICKACHDVKSKKEQEARRNNQ